MRRALVQTNEAARHPFRQRLPARIGSSQLPREPLTDFAFFCLSFVSCFIIIMGMIA